MGLNWDDDYEDETVFQVKKKKPDYVVHEEVTVPFASTQELKPASIRREQFAQDKVPANTQERFAAFLIDSVVLYYLYWISGFLFLTLTSSETLNQLHQSSLMQSLHYFLATSLGLAYFILTETYFLASLGKLLCGLRVLQEDGKFPQKGAILTRNLLKLFEYPFFFISIISMESSQLVQSIGDKAAKTVVVRIPKPYQAEVDLRRIPVSSTLSRALSQIIDLILSLILFYGYYLLLSPNYKMLSYLLFYSFPVLYLTYFCTQEYFWGTSPGKYLFNRKVVMDDGDHLKVSSTILRNLFRPLDLIFGGLVIFVSKNKQRLGDLVANTLVIRQNAQAQAKIAMILFSIIPFLFLTMGMMNSKSYPKLKYKLNNWQAYKILALNQSNTNTKTNKTSLVQKRKPVTLTTHKLPQSTSKEMKVQAFKFGTGPKTINNNNLFRRGDLIYTFFSLEGFSFDSENKMNLNSGFKVIDPFGKIIEDKPDAIQKRGPSPSGKNQIYLAHKIELEKDSPLGEYTIQFIIKDVLNNTQLTFEKKFKVK